MLKFTVHVGARPNAARLMSALFGWLGRRHLAASEPSLTSEPDAPTIPIWQICVGGFFALCILLDLVRRFCLLRRHSFRGKHVIITGGSQGIGKALGAALLKRGARVTLLARTTSTLAAAVDELRAGAAKPNRRPSDVEVQYVSASTTEPAALNAAVAQAVSTFGPCDALIACAGSANPGLFLEQPASEFARAVELNYMGTVHSIKAVIEPMVQRRRGHIIIVSSGLGVTAMMGMGTYTPTKWAVRGLADTLRNEFVGLGVAVQIGYPPDTDTPGFEHEQMSKPHETKSMVRAFPPPPSPLRPASAPRDAAPRPVAAPLLAPRASAAARPALRCQSTSSARPRWRTRCSMGRRPGCTTCRPPTSASTSSSRA